MRSQTRVQADRDQELAGRALELYKQGMTFRQVAERINRSVSRTHALVRRELEEVASHRRELAGLLFDELVERERLVISEALTIAFAACPVCRSSDALACQKCAGTGRQASARDRLAALDRVRRSDELLARLTGMEPPQRTRVAVESEFPYGYLLSLSEEELDRELEYMLPVGDVPARDGAVQAESPGVSVELGPAPRLADELGGRVP